MRDVALLSLLPLSQLTEGAGHETGHFVTNDGVNAGDIRLCHRISLFGNEGVSRMTGLIVSMRLYEECHRQDEICSLLICAGL